MKSGGSKQKGSSFERKICWRLSRFLDPKGTETLFWRSAMSGGRATLQNQKGIKNVKQLGDITCIDSKGMWLTEYFIIECKHYKKLDIEQFLFKNIGRLAKFWRKLRKDCRKHDLAPLLIAKQNNFPVLVLTNQDGLTKLDTITSPSSIIHRAYNGTSVYICIFDEVFK